MGVVKYVSMSCLLFLYTLSHEHKCLQIDAYTVLRKQLHFGYRVGLNNTSWWSHKVDKPFSEVVYIPVLPWYIPVLHWYIPVLPWYITGHLQEPAELENEENQMGREPEEQRQLKDGQRKHDWNQRNLRT